MNKFTETDSLASFSENLLDNKKKGDSFSRREIEEIARKLQIAMWNDRANIWRMRRDITPREVLDPSIALGLIGYNLDMCESLGQYSKKNKVFEIAGTIDDFDRLVQISRRFSPATQKYTTAHELGHAILHKANSLHRDRALDGRSGNVRRKDIEAEADIFAAAFLMPEKLIKITFKILFLTDHFTINEDTTFALGFENIPSLEKKVRTLRDLAKLLANAEQYNGQAFHSLAHQFGVSQQAMAIRLEELNLVSL